LSKCTGLAPLSLAYTRDKESRVTVTLKTSLFGVLYNLFLTMWIIGEQCYEPFAAIQLPAADEKTIKVIILNP
jgi:hypothetical protein